MVTRSHDVPFDIGAGVVYERTGPQLDPGMGQADALMNKAAAEGLALAKRTDRRAKATEASLNFKKG